jgi:hypothetical protein
MEVALEHGAGERGVEVAARRRSPHRARPSEHLPGVGENAVGRHAEASAARAGSPVGVAMPAISASGLA